MDKAFEQLISRNRFLKTLLAVSAALSAPWTFQSCSPVGPTPKLRGITAEEYHGMNAVAEVFLENNPIEGFDFGLGFDQYIYGHPYPIETEAVLKYLASIPISRLISLVLDFSFTPLAQLDKEKRKERLLSWKNSDSGLKRGAYAILRQVSFFILSGDKNYQKYMGYEV